MRSKRLSTIIVTLGLLCAAPFVARADDASRKAKAEELLKVSNSEQMMVQMLDSMQKMQTEQFAKMEMQAEARAQADEGFKRMEAVVRKMMSWEALKPQFIELYATTYTEAELDGIVGFYKSPAGRAMLDKMPLLMQGSMAISQKAMAALMPEIAKIAEEMKQKK